MFLLCVPGLHAQEAAALAELQTLSAQASVIFAGEVIAIVRPISESTGVVEIRFRVDAPVRGCDASGTYTLREWAGLWSGNAPRYRVGQRLLMLLPATVAGGVSTPVGGLDGAIPLVPIPAPSAEFTDKLGLDLRWIATRGQRTLAEPTTGGDRWVGPIRPLTRTTSTSPTSLTAVIALLSATAPGTSYAGH
jgi:hypothetical protein